MIEVEGLTKVYGDFVAVSGLSFTVKPGELLGLVGPNGAGKTSTLRCCSGIIPPTSGRIRVCGHDLSQDPVAAKRQLAFFSDEPRLFEYLTVRQHLVFTGRLYQVPDAADRIPRILEELDLTSKGDQMPGELSRGMKQKVAIACGLLHSPQVVFFDEPLTGLDPLAIRRMKDTIRRLAAEGKGRSHPHHQGAPQGGRLEARALEDPQRLHAPVRSRHAVFLDGQDAERLPVVGELARRSAPLACACRGGGSCCVPAEHT